MDKKKLIKIDSVVKYKDVFTQVDNVNKHIWVQQGEKINMTTSKSAAQYNKAKLYSIVNKVRGDPRYEVINSITCNNIRKLNLNRRGCRGGVMRKAHLDIIHPKCSDNDNLIIINTGQQEITPNHHSLCIYLANIKSIKSKQLILHQYLVENYINLCVLIETWLSDTETDQVWLQCSSVNNDGFKWFTSNIQGRRWGGLALISRDRYKVVSLGTGQLWSFQFSTWRIRLKHMTLTV